MVILEGRSGQQHQSTGLSSAMMRCTSLLHSVVRAGNPKITTISVSLVE